MTLDDGSQNRRGLVGVGSMGGYQVTEPSGSRQVNLLLRLPTAKSQPPSGLAREGRLSSRGMSAQQ